MLARTDQRVDILSMTRTFVLYYVSCDLAHLQQGRGFFNFFIFLPAFSCTLKEGVNSLCCSAHMGKRVGCPLSIPGRAELDKMVEVKDFTLVSAEGLSSSLKIKLFDFLISLLPLARKRIMLCGKGHSERSLELYKNTAIHPFFLSCNHLFLSLTYECT